jgi:TonB family protein
MNSLLVLTNLWSWSLEIAILVGVAALVARLVSQPELRLRFWQAAIVVAVLLPLAAPWRQPPVITRVADGSVSIATLSSDDVAEPRAPSFGSGQALELIAAGAILRLLWLSAGCYRLRRLRTRATPLSAAPVEDGARVLWFESAGIAGPVTFGWLRPAILLPERVCELPQPMRAAIAFHELVHVQRRDWLFVIAEEVLRSLLWFHPAIWYALGQIQLAREHAVDRETVALTQDRDGYLEALLAVAAHQLLPDVAPASLFLKKRQLASRLAALMKENAMSPFRLFARVFAAVSAAAAAAVLAVWMFPLQSAAQVVADDTGITVDAGAKLLHRTPLRYPGVHASGTVLVEATLSSKGEVMDARVLSGPDELRRGVLASVLEWHYSADVAPPPTVRISVRFEQAASAAQAPPAPPRTPQVKGGLPPSAAQWTGTVSDIRYTGLSAELQQQVESRLPVRKGDPYTHDTYPTTVAALSSVDEHLRLTVQVTRDGGPVILVIALPAGQAAGVPSVPGGRGGAAPAGTDPELRARIEKLEIARAAAATANPPQRIRVGGNAQSANVITKVTPVYPPLAKAAHVTGTVSLAVIISKAGTVDEVEVISGDPLLVPSALEAVKQWVYRPTLLNGSPVEVLTQVDINYTLAQ